MTSIKQHLYKNLSPNFRLKRFLYRGDLNCKFNRFLNLRFLLVGFYCIKLIIYISLNKMTKSFKKDLTTGSVHWWKLPQMKVVGYFLFFLRTLLEKYTLKIYASLNFHGWLHFWKHLRHFCWRKVMKVKTES